MFKRMKKLTILHINLFNNNMLDDEILMIIMS